MPYGGTAGSTNILMEFEWARYESFKNFPEESQAYPSQLAKAGFYYVGPGDTVRCFACQCIYKNWKENDSPAIVHQRVSPACSLQGNINIHGQREAPQMGRAHVPVDDKTLHSVRTSVSTDKRSIDAHTLKEDECCKYKQHAKVSQRHISFQNWPNHEVQSPKMLAEAGLFYIGIGDVVRCYSCGIELRDWEREDNPWQEHRRFSPNCVHLRLNGHQGGMQSIHSNNSQSDFHLEYGGAHGFEESLSKNMGNDTHPRPLGRDVFNFDSLERSLIRSNAEKSSTECEKQQYLQGSLHNYNLTKVKLQQISLQNMKLKEENIAKENSLKNEIKKLQMKVQELKPFKKSMLCKICLCDNINIVLLPCAHFVCCSQCSTQIQRCCVCRSDIKERVRVYMA